MILGDLNLFNSLTRKEKKQIRSMIHSVTIYVDDFIAILIWTYSCLFGQ